MAPKFVQFSALVLETSEAEQLAKAQPVLLREFKKHGIPPGTTVVRLMWRPRNPGLTTLVIMEPRKFPSSSSLDLFHNKLGGHLAKALGVRCWDAYLTEPDPELGEDGTTAHAYDAKGKQRWTAGNGSRVAREAGMDAAEYIDRLTGHPSWGTAHADARADASWAAPLKKLARKSTEVEALVRKADEETRRKNAGYVEPFEYVLCWKGERPQHMGYALAMVQRLLKETSPGYFKAYTFRTRTSSGVRLVCRGGEPQGADKWCSTFIGAVTRHGLLEDSVLVMHALGQPVKKVIILLRETDGPTGSLNDVWLPSAPKARGYHDWVGFAGISPVNIYGANGNQLEQQPVEKVADAQLTKLLGKAGLASARVHLDEAFRPMPAAKPKRSTERRAG